MLLLLLVLFCIFVASFASVVASLINVVVLVFIVFVLVLLFLLLVGGGCGSGGFVVSIAIASLIGCYYCCSYGDYISIFNNDCCYWYC